MLERDTVEDFEKPRGQTKGVHPNKLVKVIVHIHVYVVINELGISFSIWNKRNVDGSESQLKEFTSLLGTQKEKAFKGTAGKA